MSTTYIVNFSFQNPGAKDVDDDEVASFFLLLEGGAVSFFFHF